MKVSHWMRGQNYNIGIINLEAMLNPSILKTVLSGAGSI